LRKLCYKMIKHPVWENGVIALILLSSLKLATDTYTPQLLKNGVDIVDWSTNIDLFFNAAFFFEMLIKLIALGFCMDDGSYLRDSWN